MKRPIPAPLEPVRLPSWQEQWPLMVGAAGAAASLGFALLLFLAYRIS